MNLENTEVMLANGSVENNGKPIVITINSGQTTSDTPDLYGSTLLALTFPAGTVSATFTIMASIDNVNFFTLKDAYTGNPITIDAIAGDFARVLPQDFAGIKYIQLVSSVIQTSTIRIQVISGQVL